MEEENNNDNNSDDTESLDQKLNYFIITLNSHEEDHDGYCSGTEADIDDCEIIIIIEATINNETDQTKASINSIIDEKNINIPNEFKKVFEVERLGCTSVGGSGY